MLKYYHEFQHSDSTALNQAVLMCLHVSYDRPNDMPIKLALSLFKANPNMDLTLSKHFFKHLKILSIQKSTQFNTKCFTVLFLA